MNNRVDSENHIVIGRIGSTYGIKGWLKVQSFTAPETNIFDYQPWLYQKRGQWVVLECDTFEAKPERLLIHIKGYDNPEMAKQLTGLEIATTRDQLPKLPKGEYYWHDLIGLEVVTTKQVSLGKVKNILSNAAHPLLEIQGEKQHLLPLLFDKFIVEVNLSERKIIADWDPEF